MINRGQYPAWCLLLWAMTTAAQGPMHIQEVGAFTPNALLSSGQMNMELWSATNAGKNRSPLQGPSGSVSGMDTRAPAKARREYEKGYQLLMRKDLPGAVEHLQASLAIYPQFVAAHNALGSSYLDLKQNEQAHEQFAQAISLDDHLPNSYLNLGCAELALKNYRAAEASIQKASALAPLDLQFLTALTYAQFLNQDYAAAIATAHQVESRKHPGAAIVRYYAAAAWEAQNNLQESQRELEALLREDPTSPAAKQARTILQQLRAEPAIEAKKTMTTPQVSLSDMVKPGSVRIKPEDPSVQKQIALQELKEQTQVAEAESICATCDSIVSPAPVAGGSRPTPSEVEPGGNASPWTWRSAVDEVTVFFSATHRGGSVVNLSRGEVSISDNKQPPAAITEFRNEAQLPLRLGLVIDTSQSIESRFSFEQRAATNFLQRVMTDKNDLAFVVGVASSVLLVQDFTSDQKQIAHSIAELAPSGGTAIWDAVGFAADKLASRSEDRPAARVLVVISDGHDNSSSATLKEAIQDAERRDIIVYTVSAGAQSSPDADSLGDRALTLLAESTGGAAFFPGSLGFLNRSLAQLQDVIRSRYMISYRPALFDPDGRFHTIHITAEKSGQKLRVYARKGYYANVNSPP
jgi:Ca-activated chloride channel family protein